MRIKEYWTFVRFVEGVEKESLPIGVEWESESVADTASAAILHDYPSIRCIKRERVQLKPTNRNGRLVREVPPGECLETFDCNAGDHADCCPKSLEPDGA